MAAATPPAAVAAAKNRALGAILGSLVADAATAPVHWIYDLEKMGKIVAEGPTEFHEPQGPFYRRTLGLHTGYGDLNANVLKFLAANSGVWDAAKYATAVQLDFGPGSQYDQFGQLEGGIPEELWPVAGPWLQAGLRTFLRNVKEGKTGADAADITDDQGDAVSRIPALAASRAYAAVAGGADLGAAKAALVQEALALVGTYQAADISRGAGATVARVIFDVVAGSDIRAAVDAARDALVGGEPVPHADKLHEVIQEVVYGWAVEEGRPYADIVKESGNHCHLPPSLVTPLAALVLEAGKDKSGEELFVDTVRVIHSGGGCSGSRSNFVGAVTGAAGGLQAVPQSWRDRTTHYATYVRQAEALLGAVAAK